MRKVALDPDTLRVDSFATDGGREVAGTVHAHATPPSMCGNTCAATCQTNCDCTYGCVTLGPRCTVDG